MRVNFFKQRKNKRYNYTPRYYKGKDSVNEFEFGSKFDRFRETLNTNDFGSQWREAREQSRHRGNRGISLRLLIILLALVLICLYVLDFDLSIFNTSVNG